MERDLTSLIPSLVEDGVFGDVVFVDLETEDQDIGAQYCSSMAFVSLTIEGAAGKKVIPLVVKQQIEAYEAHELFHNELLMFQEIIPALGFDQKSYPIFYYGQVTEEISKMNGIILENVTHRNFINSKQSPFLDFEHISLAMKKIAKFHSLSYIFKHKDPNKLFEMTKKFKDKDYYDNNVLEFEKANLAAMERGVKAFQKLHFTDSIFDSFLNSIKYTIIVWRKLCKAEEPFGVVCHGDFCNNNVMYSYDTSGSPTDCLLFDFQRSQYGSPAVELAFYLYMHTTSNTREKYWDKFLKIYWETLRENVPSHIGIPPFKEFLEHFASRAVFGYLVASFFLPMLIDRSAKFWIGLSTEEEIAIARTMGGPEAEEKLADIVSDLYHRKYIQAFLDFSKKNSLVR